MLTPQEVSKRVFPKAAFGGYNMSMVDEFLDELTEDYSTLYKENATLKTKMKVLVDKVEEYRSTEDSMRAALLTAQKMATSMVAEAEERKASLLAGAEEEARQKLADLHAEISAEERRLNAAKKATEEFLAKMEDLCHQHLQLLSETPDLTPTPEEKPVAAPNYSEADVSSIEEKILASFRSVPEQEAAPAAPPAAPEEKAEATAPETEKEPFDGGETRPFKLDELQFGRNYRGKSE